MGEESSDETDPVTKSIRHESRSSTVWIGSLFFAVPLLCGPIASVVTNRLGFTKATVIGGLITAVGFISSAFVHSVGAMAVTYGCIAGLGISMPYLNSIVVVALYFEKKRSLATGILECGAVCGAVFKPLESAQEYIEVPDSDCVDKVFTEQDQGNHGDKLLPIDDDFLVTKFLKSHDIYKSNPRLFLESNSMLGESVATLPSIVRAAVSCHDLRETTKTPCKRDRAKNFGITEKIAAYMVAVIGISHTLENLLYCFLGDRKQINRRYLYSGSLLLTGVVLTIVQLFTTFLPCTILAGLFGLLSASAEALTSVIIVDILGIDKLTDAYGVVMFLQGVSNLVGPPVTGKLNKITNAASVDGYMTRLVAMTKHFIPQAAVSYFRYHCVSNISNKTEEKTAPK
ncbi:unnamed protein product [Mytilus coruscus]|uniref:Uncharacterized protein n=1 Tax=Mytilus coruscus TaxID=42192 RepID=A0A6J8AGA0_MYTCO|nr:unnamed protein product [Mytilus coruscus]